MINSKITGTGMYVPDKILTNDDLTHMVVTSDEWIVERTGIRERRIATGETASVMACKAAKKALEGAGVDGDELDLIIVSTLTPDYLIPSVACLVQREINAKNAMCFDVSAACTGFIFSLNIAKQFINAGQCRKALIIGTEILSKITNYKDRNTCVLFGDGAGAAVVESTDDEGIISIFTRSDGSRYESLICENNPINTPFYQDEIQDIDGKVRMNGKEVFKFVITVLPKCIKQVLKDSKYTIDDIKYIVPHQANARMMENVAKRMDIDIGKFYMNIEKYGNTSSASIPIALSEMDKDGLLKKGDLLILVGFGGGLTYGSMLIKW